MAIKIEETLLTEIDLDDPTQVDWLYDWANRAQKRIMKMQGEINSKDDEIIDLRDRLREANEKLEMFRRNLA